MTMPLNMSYHTTMFCRFGQIIGGVALIASLGMFALMPRETLPSAGVVLPHFSFHTATEAAVPALLSSRDKQLYQEIFNAQKAGDWTSADEDISKLENKLLMGHVLAERYLHRYNATSSELVSWLTTYNDHPQAAAIYALAATKNPGIKNDVPAIAKQPALIGYGDDNGLAVQPDDGEHAQAWRSGLDAWRANNKAAAAKFFASIVQTHDKLSPWTISAAAYWAYRCEHALGNHEEADKYLRLAAEQPRSFYGILARKQLNEALNLDSEPTTLTDSDMLEMISDPTVRRTIALSEVGMNEQAEQELRGLFLQADNQDRLRLLAIAHKLNLASVQISMAKHVSADGALDYAKYPTPNWRPQGGFKIAPELVFALMRQESGFRASAVSPGGALGLMQLMPQTAQLMEKHMSDEGISMLGSATDPVTNITLGQNYVRNLLDNELVEGNLFYMLAAYNAGPGRLKEWKASLADHGDPLLFVESIPFAQTRHYVMQVMTNFWIYSELSGKSNDSIYALLHGHWPWYDEATMPVAQLETQRVVN